MKAPDRITPKMIAPCGMNCALCIAYLRAKNPCAGCHGDDTHTPKHCTTCRIKRCDLRADSPSGYCFECETYPCTRLKRLDKRYRTKYGMSMIDNLEHIRSVGIQNFIRQEQQHWTCPECGGVLCVHRDACLFCGRKKKY